MSLGTEERSLRLGATSHQTFLKLALSCAGLALVFFLTISEALCEVEFPRVPPVDTSKLKLSDFADDELDLPYYLIHFHRIANAVETSGPLRGFINIKVWHQEKYFSPHNARMMENCVALAYFYATKRPWNPYYGHPAVRLRLEAALEYWLSIQSQEGRFSETGQGVWAVCPTAFGAMTISETMALLQDGPPIDSRLRERVMQGIRKAILVILKDDEWYKWGRGLSNQYGGVWAAGIAHLAMCPDPEIATLLRKRFEQSMDDFQSPAGFFYEAGGPDWAYNLYVEQSILYTVWHYGRRTDLENMLVKKMRRFYDWVSYNAVYEPDLSHFYLNSGVSSRGNQTWTTTSHIPLTWFGHGKEGLSGTPMAEKVEAACAFSNTRSEIRRNIANLRTNLKKQWPEVPPLVIGATRAYSPEIFLHRGHTEWYPGHRQKAKAIARLPYLVRERFIHQRVDTRRKPVIYTFIRRPAYYAIFNAGQILKPMPRFGLGLLWTQVAGTFVQTQAGSSKAAWGTLAKGAELPYESKTFFPSFRIGGADVSTETGVRDLPDSELVIKYALMGQDAKGKIIEKGKKKIVFHDAAIDVSIHHEGEFSEQIPLLLSSDDKLSIAAESVVILRDAGVMIVSFDNSACAVIEQTKCKSGSRQVVTLRLVAKNKLRYEIHF